MKKLFPKYLERQPYFIRWLIWLVAVLVIAGFLFPLAKYNGFSQWLPLFIVFPLVLLRFPCLDIPRLRSIGWSPWILILIIVPLVGFIMQLLLFFMPVRKSDA
jgi:uncharacterized membrane protein YhaH (DUF805 family)